MSLIENLNILQIYIVVLGIVVSYIWVRVARSENGGFSKRETVQLLLINIAVVMVASELGGIEFNNTKWGIAIGSLILSVGMEVYKLIKQSTINYGRGNEEPDIP